MIGSAAAYWGFAAYGLFWGAWGVSLPALQHAAGVDDAGLGLALLFVGAGALPAMMLTGRAVDRFGARIAGALLGALAVSGVLAATMARDLPGLMMTMALVGAASGAADVAINALAGLAEQRTGRRVITYAHGVFSLSVVVGSLGGGLLLQLGGGSAAPLTVAGAGAAVAALVVWRRGDRAYGVPAHRRSPRVRGSAAFLIPFVLAGAVGALGYAVENAHQSWSAIFLQSELATPPWLTALAPATFAFFAATARFAAGLLTRVPSGVILVAGGLLATAGTVLLATATAVAVALLGLALAAVGTAVLAPTMLSRATEGVPAVLRGAATSAFISTAYLGFVFGPAFVGLLAAGVDLRAALIGVAVLSGVFTVLAPLVTRRRARVPQGS